MLTRIRLLFTTLSILSFSAYAQNQDSTSLEVSFNQVVVNLDKINYHDEFFPEVPDSIIKIRLNEIQNRIPLNYHSRVKTFINVFAQRKRAFTKRMLKKKHRFFPHIEKTLEKYNMPDELKYLPIIESAFNPSAVSKANATGMWQFISSTGKRMGLNQNFYVDERRNFEKSTDAGVRYLKRLYDTFGDWELAIAAYNCGPGNIRKAQRRTGKFHFWDIFYKLPKETKSYLPQFVAMIYVISYADEYKLIQDEHYYPILSEIIYLSQSVDLGKFAKEIKICPDDLRIMNAELKFGYVPKTALNYALKIPATRLNYFVENRKSILANSVYDGKTTLTGNKYKVTRHTTKYYHRVKYGESLGIIAQKNRIRLSKLREWNNIYHNKIYPGQRLLIYKNGGYIPAKKTTKKIVSNTSVSNKAITNYKGAVYIVKRGDTLWNIAKKFERLTIQKLKQLNRLRSNKLIPGQKLKIS